MSGLTDNARSVLVIVDPAFGEKLLSIPAGRPVWITMSPENEPFVRAIWNTRETSNHLTGITGFNFSANASPEITFLDELDTIDLHHGPYSSSSSYTEIAAIGVRLTADIRAALAEHGFTDFTETEDGFTAKRSSGEAAQLRE
ncbi:hypothetical protein V1291_004465 [Nitrobacteraceae bacterium AZCC 1564]